MTVRRLALAIFLVCSVGVIGTGIVVQHTAELGLDVIYLDATWAARFYADEIPTQHAAFRTSTGLWTQLGDRTFHDGVPLMHRVGKLVGAVGRDTTTYLADEATVWVLDRGDTLIGVLRAPAPIESLALADDVPVIDTQHGAYETDVSFRTFRPRERAEVDIPAELVELTPAELASLQQRYLAEAITVERFLGDLHSGRVFGAAGAYLIDALGIVMIVALVVAVRRPRV